LDIALFLAPQFVFALLRAANSCIYFLLNSGAGDGI
jgi:hypothetical protein